MNQDIPDNWPRKWGYIWVFVCFVTGLIFVIAVLQLYEASFGIVPGWLSFILNSLWTVAVGIALIGEHTRICPHCSKFITPFRIKRFVCKRCGQLFS